MTVQDEWDYSNMISQGSLLPRDYRNNPSNVMIAIGLGRSMGLSPAESLYRINVIQGKPTASAELIAAQVRKAGHKLRIQKDPNKLSVTATIVRKDDPDYPISVTRDEEWAKRMGLINKDNYRKQPETMLTWRAITAVAREACPEALYGVAYTPDEMHDMDAVPKPQNVEAKVEPQREQVDLTPIRQRFKAYREARGGIDAKEATAELCEYAGVSAMSDLNEQQTQLVLSAMDEVISGPRQEQPEQQEEPAQEPVADDGNGEFYDQDVKF